jgi:hypothetical protein
MDELVAPALYPLSRPAKRRVWALPLGAVGAEQDPSILGFANRPKGWSAFAPLQLKES